MYKVSQRGLEQISTNLRGCRRVLKRPMLIHEEKERGIESNEKG
jgi:hypothetical protein